MTSATWCHPGGASAARSSSRAWLRNHANDRSPTQGFGKSTNHFFNACWTTSHSILAPPRRPPVPDR